MGSSHTAPVWVLPIFLPSEFNSRVMVIAYASFPSFRRISSVPPSMLRPLVVAAELHVTAIFLVQHVEIVALHDHVVEFQEAQSLCHTLFIALCTQHVVDGEACADLSEAALHNSASDSQSALLTISAFPSEKSMKRLICCLKQSQLCWIVSGVSIWRMIASAGRITDHAGTAAD